MTQPLPTPAPRGVRLTVHRAFNSTNGISRHHDHVTVVGYLDDTNQSFQGPFVPAAERVQALPDDLQNDDVTDDAPPVWLRARTVNNMGLVLSLDPATAVGAPRPWFMYSGNSANSTDPRWVAFLAVDVNAVVVDAIHIHDRVEA